jgi:DNA uptake protein ComE-like DNA-binding protein
MKSRASFAGWIPVAVVALTMVACSHSKTEAEKESAQQQQQAAGQSKQGQAPSTAATTGAPQAQAPQQSSMLGEQSTAQGTAQIQRQKKVVSTVIVKEKIPTVKETTIRADINRMDAKQFTAIGFPSDVSQSIIQYRDRNGPFHSVNELTNVEGVSQSLVDKFDGSLGVNPSLAAQSAAGISGQGSSDQGQGSADQSSSSDSQSSAGQQPGQSDPWNSNQ